MSEIDLVRPGHELSAEEMNRRRRVMLRRSQGRRCWIDTTGEYLLDMPGGGTAETPLAEVHFELKEALEVGAEEPVEALPRYFDPDANDGFGGWVTDCEGDTLWVFDCKGLGFAGGVGAVGWGFEREVSNEEKVNHKVIEVNDLQCPPDVTSSCQ